MSLSFDPKKLPIEVQHQVCQVVLRYIRLIRFLRRNVIKSSFIHPENTFRGHTSYLLDPTSIGDIRNIRHMNIEAGEGLGSKNGQS